MADELQNLTRALTSGEVDFKSPVSEDITQAFARLTPELLLAFIISNSSKILQGAIDATPSTGGPSTITDINPTAGSFARDDQFQGAYLHFIDGTIFTNNSINRFKITSVDAGLSQITVAEDLAALGATIGDLYEIIGHTHDGDSTNSDGAKIDLKDLVNVLEDSLMTQNLADAITDPDGNRDAATKANPFITATDAGIPFTWVDDGTSFTSGGTIDISAIVPVGTLNAQILAIIEGTTTSTIGVTARVVATGTYRTIIRQTSPSTSVTRSGGCVIVPVDGSRQIDITTEGSADAFEVQVRSYQ